MEGIQLEMEGGLTDPNADAAPPLAARSKSAAELIRENMPDRGLRRFVNWVQHLFTTFGRDVVIVMSMVYVMQGARVAFLVRTVPSTSATLCPVPRGPRQRCMYISPAADPNAPYLLGADQYLAVDYACMDANVGLGLSAGQAAAIKATAYLPWSFKPFYGITADLVPLWGSHRKHWLMLLSVMGGCVAFAMTLITPGSDSAPTLFTFLLVVNNFCVACCDVLADAMVAEFAKLERGRGAGNLQVCVFGSQNLGQIVLNIFAGDVLAWCGPWPMFAGFGIMQAGIAGVAMTLHETPDEEPVTIAKVKRQLVLLKKTLQYPPIYMPAIFFFLINGGRPDITNGALQLITDQDNGYGINIDPYHYIGNSATDFGLQPMSDRDEGLLKELPEGTDPTTWIGCDTFTQQDLGCAAPWLVDMEQKSRDAPHVSGITFSVKIAAKEHFIYLPNGYSFNYNLVDDSEQQQKVGESFAEYQLRLITDVENTLNSGNIRTYYEGIEGDAVKEDSRPKGHIFTLVPLLGPGGIPMDAPSCSSGDICKNVFTPNGVCGGDGTSCGASLLAEAYRSCPVACQECQYTGGGNGREGVGTIMADSPHRGCVGFSPIFISRSQLPGNFIGLLAQNLFAAYFIDTPIRKLIFACNVVLFLTCFVDLALFTGAYTWFGLGPELFFILGDRTITYFCGWLGWMPMATLAAQICPPSVEATLFGLLMSCLNLGTSTSAYWGAWLLQSVGVTQISFGGMVDAQWTLTICRFFIPFLVLIFVPKGDPTSMIEEFERQNKDIMRPKSGGLGAPQTIPTRSSEGGQSNGQEPMSAPPATTAAGGEVTAL